MSAIFRCFLLCIATLCFVAGTGTRGAAQSLRGATRGCRTPYGCYRARIRDAEAHLALRFSRAQRQSIHREMAAGEARAQDNAVRLFPLPSRITAGNLNFVQIQQMRRFQAMMRGIEQCHRSMRRRYALTEDEREAISESADL